MQFFVDTYEERVPAEEDGIPERRHPYLASHPRAKSHRRVMRPADHRNLPEFIGQYFPRADDPATREFYCASMLLLLKPWRDVRNDLRGVDETWQSAFDNFINQASPHTRRIVENIQFYYRARAAADQDPDRMKELEDLEEKVEDETSDAMYNEEEALEVVQQSETPNGESPVLAHFGNSALDIAKMRGIFSHTSSEWGCFQSPAPGSAAALQQVSDWTTLLTRANDDDHSADEKTQEPFFGRMPRRSAKRPKIVRTDEPLPRTTLSSRSQTQIRKDVDCLALCEGLGLDILNDAQFRAFDIVAWQMEQRLNGHHPPPLRMRLTGCPGTGKSKVIEKITQAMNRWGLGHRMLRAAYTGIAASAIDGQTVHSILCAQGTRIPPDISEARRQKLQALWDDKILLIVDEDSMINKTLLSKLVRAVAVGRAPSDPNVNSLPFGDLDVIFCGDDHQFPPVAKSVAERLYYHMDLGKDSPERAEGKRVRDSLQTVVVLKQQASAYLHLCSLFSLN